MCVDDLSFNPFLHGVCKLSALILAKKKKNLLRFELSVPYVDMHVQPYPTSGVSTPSIALPVNEEQVGA
jgi:hypothetical protein